MLLHERIKHEMKKNGISQNRLAKAANMSQSGLSSIVNGSVSPKEETLRMIADALGCSVSSLLGETPAENAEDMSPSVRQLMDYVKTVPEDKAAYVLRVMQTILSDESRK